MIEFGKRIDGAIYVERPGAYAVVKDGLNRVALVRTRKGHFLAGGAIEENETVEEALLREVLEETGYESTIVAKIGIAAQYLCAETDGTHFRKVGHFFLANFTDKDPGSASTNHELVWYPLAEALEKLTHEFHAWAVREAFANNPK